MKRAVIFSNGELTDLSRLRLKKNDLLIGVDGGTRPIFKLGLEPDLIIGDLDSLKEVPPNIPVIKYPEDKDFTDTELALKHCVKQKIKEVVLVGFLGRRLDHLLANVMNLIKFKFKIIEGNQEIFICFDRVEIRGSKDELVSLIPFFRNCRGVTTKGLKWKLQGRTLKAGSSLGVSNVMLGKIAEISLKSGNLLVVHTYKDGPCR